jgi:hypothetical protein
VREQYDAGGVRRDLKVTLEEHVTDGKPDDSSLC